MTGILHIFYVYMRNVYKYIYLVERKATAIKNFMKIAVRECVCVCAPVLYVNIAYILCTKTVLFS